MGLKEKINGYFTQNSKKYKTFFIPSCRTDVTGDGEAFKSGEAYCRFYLVEMRLAKGVEWFSKRYPVVHSNISFVHGQEKAAMPYLAGPGFLKNLTSDNLDQIINCNHPLTGLFPFNRGDVEFQAGLFSMKTSDQIKKFVDTLGRFSKLLAIPELAKTANLVPPVLQGISDLIDVGDSRMELGYHQTFSDADGGGGNILRSGYFAAVLAEEADLDTAKLCVADDELRIGREGKNQEFLTDHKPFEDSSYMLFRIQKKPEQDWEALTEVKSLVERIFNTLENGNGSREATATVKKELWPNLKRTVRQSPDIAKKDKRNMLLRIKAEILDWGLESTEKSAASLRQIMHRPLPEMMPEMEAELDELETLYG